MVELQRKKVIHGEMVYFGYGEMVYLSFNKDPLNIPSSREGRKCGNRIRKRLRCISRGNQLVSHYPSSKRKFHGFA
jgi:hypothetical protein